VFPLFCIGAWTAAMSAFYEDGDCAAALAEENNATSPVVCQSSHTCWEGYTDEPYLLILSVPMITALAVSERT